MLSPETQNFLEIDQKPQISPKKETIMLLGYLQWGDCDGLPAVFGRGSQVK